MWLQKVVTLGAHVGRCSGNVQNCVVVNVQEFGKSSAFAIRFCEVKKFADIA